ncbi:MAG TPA: GspH/FimT family pseudopilin [Caulobacteraceae bacterium]|jgi:general secretion pathway protein H
MSATGKAREAGFTLLEALVVVTIAATISALIFPSLQRTLTALSLRQSASVFTARLRAARGQAIREARPIAVAATTDGAAYAWTGAQPQRLPGAVRLATAGQRPLVFYPDGSSSGGQAVMAAGARRIPISVDASTGAVMARP